MAKEFILHTGSYAINDPVVKYSNMKVICSDGEKKVYNARNGGYLRVEFQGNIVIVVSVSSQQIIEKFWGHSSPIYFTGEVL